MRLHAAFSALADRDERVVRPYVAANLYLVGGLITLVTLAIPGIEGRSTVAFLTAAGVAFALALLHVVAGRRLRDRHFHVLGVCATLLIGSGVYFGGDVWISYPFLWIWSALFFAFFFSARAALAHVGFMAAVLLGLLLTREPALVALTYTLVAASGIGGASAFVGLLKSRLEDVQSDERAYLEEAIAARTAELAERETMLRALMDNVPGAVAQFAAGTPGSPIIFMSDEVDEITGLPRESFIDEPAERLLALVHPDDRDAVAEAHAQAMEGGESFHIEFRITRSDGEMRWVSERGQVTRDEDGGVSTVDALFLDVTEQRLAEQRVVDAEERYRMLVEEIPLVVYMCEVDDERERLRYVGPHIEQLSGHTTWEWLAPSGLWAKAIHEEDRARVFAARERHVSAGEPFSEEYRITRKDGSECWFQDEAVVERDETGQIVASRGYVADISTRKELEEQLSHQAVHDALTGLANRVLLKDRVTHALERRDRGGQAVALLFIDMDDFKTINDSLGHQAGDALLVEAANRLREVLRPGDTPARLGGDEFAVLLEDCEGVADANAAANRIAEAFSEPFVVQGRDVVMAASIGIAVEDGRGATASELLRDADVAMYRAKSAGKGRAETYQPSMRAEAVLRFERTSELRRACENGEFSLRYQPIVSLESGDVGALEALVRWEHPRWRELAPGDFIPLAEETGLIVPLGEWVLERVCRAACTWVMGNSERRLEWLSANVSLRELQESDYTERVAKILAKTGVDPSAILLEVTESAVMTNLDGMIAKLDELRAMGLRVAVDDFGTGYSSLEYLRRLPIDMVKVASPFIQGIGVRDGDTELARAILQLGDLVGIETIAEGVQSAEQRDVLLDIGCRLGQGFFFSEPMTEAQVLELLGAAHLRAA